MLTWAYAYMLKTMGTHSQLGHVVPMLCDVAIFYNLAHAMMGRCG